MRILSIALTVCLVLGVASCNRYDSPVNALNGTMSGFVNVNDEDGLSLEDLSGVTVSLDGTTIKTQSDANGHWKLEDVPSGVYSISYAKQGYGTNKIVSYNFAGNGDAYLPLTQISVIPTLTSFITSMVLDTSAETPAMVLTGAVSRPINLTTNRTVIIFFGSTSNVSSDPTTYGAQSLAFVPGGSSEFSQIFSAQQLHSMGFKAGQHVYVTSYAASKQYYRYVDVNTGRNRFCGISEKNLNFKEFLCP